MLSSKCIFNLFYGIAKKNLRIGFSSIRYMSYEENSLDKYRIDMTEDSNNFRNYFPIIKAKVMKEFCEVIKDNLEIIHFEKFIDYNFVHPYPWTTALMMIRLYRILEKAPGGTTSLQNADLYTIGWLLELLMKPVYLIDDMIDHSVARIGLPCWYRFGNNAKKLPADNDKLFLLTFRLLQLDYEHRPFYKNIAEVFYKYTLIGHVGTTISIGNRMLDGTAKPGNYKNQTFYFAASYIGIPMFTAIYLTGYENELKMEKLFGIIEDLAYYIKVVNERDDTFGVKYENGKRSVPAHEDLKLGLATWFLEQALLDGNDQQKEIIKKHFGRQDPSSIQTIINVYNELRLLDKFDLFAKDMYVNLMNEAKNFPSYFAAYIDEVYNLLDGNPESLGKLDEN